MSAAEDAGQPVIQLWDDNPSGIDLLGFASLASPILAALSSGGLDPLTIGIHGPWGSGKSTLLRLLEGALAKDERYLVVSTTPWEYEDHSDVKGMLIGSILGALEQRVEGEADWAKLARMRIGNLAKRVSWSRVSAALAKGSITMAWNPVELLEAFALKPIEPRTLVGFRSEFGELVGDLQAVSGWLSSSTISIGVSQVRLFRP